MYKEMGDTQVSLEEQMQKQEPVLNWIIKKGKEREGSEKWFCNPSHT